MSDCVEFSTVFQEVSLTITELLFLFSSRKIGGLGLTQGQIAIYCIIRPISIFLYEMGFYTRVSKRMGGTIPLLKKVAWIYPVIYIFYLVVSQAALSEKLTATFVLLALAISLVLQITANSSHICVEILMTSRAPTEEQLSTIAAIYEVAGQCGVGTAAVFGSSVFAHSAGMHDGFFRFKLVWIVCAGSAAINALIIGRLTQIDG